MGVYNPADGNRFLESVHSIVRQTFQDWELMIYDDGSKAAYLPLFQAATKLDSRIRLLHGKHNRGLAHALNEGIRHARGCYVARMDDDDWAMPDRLRKQVTFLEAHPKYQWVGSNAELMDKHGVWGLLRVPQRPQTRDFLPHSPYIHPSVMFRKEVLLRSGGYREEARYMQCEDYELFMRLHSQGETGFNLQEPLLQYWEDRSSYRKRTYARRVREMKLRYHGFQELGIMTPAALPYVIKPLAVGMIPGGAYGFIRRKSKKWRKKQGEGYGE